MTVVNLAAYRAEQKARAARPADLVTPWLALYGLSLACFAAPLAIGAKLMLASAEHSLEIASARRSR